MTSPQWGRRDEAGRWMRRLPAGTLTACLLAAVTFYGATEFRVRYRWTPNQQEYLRTYLRANLALTLGLPPRSYALPLGDKPGAVYDNAEVERFLRLGVYGGQSLRDLARAPLLAAGLVLAVGLVFGVPIDARTRRARRHGRRTKGPELVSAETFNGPCGDGRLGGLRVLQHRAPTVMIPRRLEASHVLILGDTGTGKSSLIRQFLCQIRDRGETAVVYDPAREYLPQFLDRERGDQVLNPLDARCPYWTPGDEVRVDPEALTLATALFPSRPNENPFFTEGPRRIFAYLLTKRPSAELLARWLADGDQLDGLLAGTPYAAMIDPHAPQQRAGVLASLNMQADTLTMLPRSGEASGRWSASAWARERQGWLFFTSGPETRERQIPLMTLWLDLLILRLMQGAPGPKTWIIIDELASLRRLPQLQTAMTESRKVNTPLVVGFQARSQMEALYGHAAEAILSQPATKILLRTSEANSAEWVSKTIGSVEIERMRESRAHGGRRSINYALERAVEPLVLPSEIEGLADRTGYLKCGNLVTPLSFPYLILPTVAEPFVPCEPGRLAPVAPRVGPSPEVPLGYQQAQFID